MGYYIYKKEKKQNNGERNIEGRKQSETEEKGEWREFGVNQSLQIVAFCQMITLCHMQTLLDMGILEIDNDFQERNLFKLAFLKLFNIWSKNLLTCNDN